MDLKRVRVQFPASTGCGTEIVSLTATSGESLDAVLRRAAITVRADCGGHGTCGQCAARVATDSHNGTKRPPENSFRELRLCRTLVDRDLFVQLPDESVPRKCEEIHRVESTAMLRGSNASDSGTYYAAVDLGTTTIVVSLLDAHEGISLGSLACPNPQVETGCDIISRIQYATSSEEHRERMQAMLVGEVDRMIARLVQARNIFPASVTRVVVAGNTAMTWFFCGIDSSPLAHYPFQPHTKKLVPGRNVPAIIFPSFPSAVVTVMPIFAGFVGGDIVAGVLSLEKKGALSKGPVLFLDLGTNGELALVTEHDIFVASTAAGPAFEGAGIECGMTAGPGAIEAVDFSDAPYWLDGERSDESIKVIGAELPRGICGSGLVDATAELLRFGMIDRGGRFRDPASLRYRPGEVPVLPMFSRMEVRGTGKVFRLADEPQPVWLSQGDLRAVQLATGAIRAGTRLVLRHAGLTCADLEHVWLAGLFGNHLCLDNAQRIGLLPPEMDSGRIGWCGNSSLRGTEEYALDDSLEIVTNRLIDRARHIDLAAEPDFEDVFIESLIFP